MASAASAAPGTGGGAGGSAGASAPTGSSNVTREAHHHDFVKHVHVERDRVPEFTEQSLSVVGPMAAGKTTLIATMGRELFADETQTMYIGDGSKTCTQAAHTHYLAVRALGSSVRVIDTNGITDGTWAELAGELAKLFHLIGVPDGHTLRTEDLRVCAKHVTNITKRNTITGAPTSTSMMLVVDLTGCKNNLLDTVATVAAMCVTSGVERANKKLTDNKSAKNTFGELYRLLQDIQLGIANIDKARGAGSGCIPFPYICITKRDVLYKPTRVKLAARFGDSQLHGATNTAMERLVQLVSMRVGLHNQHKDHPGVFLVDARGKTEESRLQIHKVLRAWTTQAANYSSRLALSIKQGEAQAATAKLLQDAADKERARIAEEEENKAKEEAKAKGGGCTIM